MSAATSAGRRPRISQTLFTDETRSRCRVGDMAVSAWTPLMMSASVATAVVTVAVAGTPAGREKPGGWLVIGKPPLLTGVDTG
jgi:hypothetical protein